MSIKIKMPQGHFNSWLTIVNELRTTYYNDVISFTPNLSLIKRLFGQLDLRMDIERQLIYR